MITAAHRSLAYCNSSQYASTVTPGGVECGCAAEAQPRRHPQPANRRLHSWLLPLRQGRRELKHWYLFTAKIEGGVNFIFLDSLVCGGSCFS